VSGSNLKPGTLLALLTDDRIELAMRKNLRFSSIRTGFTLVEAIIVVAIISIIASIGLPALLHMVHRSKIEGIARQTAVLMRKARLEAIKQNVQTVVEINTVTGEITAFADVDGAAAGAPPDGFYNAIVGEARGETDYFIGTPYIKPERVNFDFPPMDLLEPRASTFENLLSDGFPDAIAIFQPNGSILNTGAIRFGDNRGNFLEVRVDPAATARIQIRKWNEAVINASAFDDPNHWFSPGDENLPWKWY
jgi:prepilin-type N-terminal cleavage/methylation domain-containing protein